jgi:cytoskeletal protein CcmA (bactofilin family)
VTIGRNSNVEGDIVAREAILYGRLSGDLDAHDRMEIKKGGSFTGDLTTGRISIEEGAFFKGHIEVDPSTKPLGADLGAILERGEKSS